MATNDLTKLVKSIDLLSARISGIENSMLETTDGMRISNELSDMEKHLAITADKFSKLTQEITDVKQTMATQKETQKGFKKLDHKLDDWIKHLDKNAMENRHRLDRLENHAGLPKFIDL